MAKPARPARILIIDDSAFVRKVVREILSGSPFLDVVGAARDGEQALEMVAALNPDVAICDLQMPVLDGVGFVREQMRRRPLPILILSAAAQDATEVIAALDAGAVDIVQKPSALATDELRAVREELVAKLIAVAQVPVANLAFASPHAVATLPIAARPSRVDVVVVGISTGGPQALRRMIPMLPANFPVPIAVVLHMPVGYTALYAEKLNEICSLEVKEVRDGDELVAGCVLIAQAGRHLNFRRNAAGRVVAELTMAPMEKIHRPSADVLFRSAAEIFRDRVLGVVMTGMGDDGKEGSAWIKAQGGTVLTEDEKSCVIYGMPRSVYEAGLSDAAITLDNMAEAITARI
ncbi:MAG: response regulator receiver modulated CheB methylesterase [Verrucomicrobia bacterium]|nr:response regulator receiver modulated CheB methylesterase [Verrucomicrobiota bacterium]